MRLKFVQKAVSVCYRSRPVNDAYCVRSHIQKFIHGFFSFVGLSVWTLCVGSATHSNTAVSFHCDQVLVLWHHSLLAELRAFDSAHRTPNSCSMVDGRLQRLQLCVYRAKVIHFVRFLLWLFWPGVLPIYYLCLRQQLSSRQTCAEPLCTSQILTNRELNTVPSDNSREAEQNCCDKLSFVIRAIYLRWGEYKMASF